MAQCNPRWGRRVDRALDSDQEKRKVHIEYESCQRNPNLVCDHGRGSGGICLLKVSKAVHKTQCAKFPQASWQHTRPGDLVVLQEGSIHSKHVSLAKLEVSEVRDIRSPTCIRFFLTRILYKGNLATVSFFINEQSGLNNVAELNEQRG
jgi:hypothetical protein